MNINYLDDNDQKRLLVNLFLIYNLKGIVDFPTRTIHSTVSAIDTFIINTAQINKFSITSFINGLSDYDALIYSLNIPTRKETDKVTYTRIVDKYTTSDFIYKISSESWDEVFNSSDIDFMFNSFHNTYLRIYYSSFPLLRTKRKNYKYNWITLGIKTSCKRKRAIFLMQRNNADPVLKQYYKRYSKILHNVIKEAKRMSLDEKIKKSDNKTKATWTIIKALSGKHHTLHEIQKLSLDGNLLTDHHEITEAFNK